MKKLIGRTDVDDALKRLDKLTDEEARMATAQVLRVTQIVAEDVDQVKRSSFVYLIGSDCGVSRPCRKAIVERPPQMALSIGSVHES